MSKHHQASRRRSYRRRQHELHERVDRGESRRQDLPEARDGVLVLEEPRPGPALWTASAWAGLR